MVSWDVHVEAGTFSGTNTRIGRVQFGENEILEDGQSGRRLVVEGKLDIQDGLQRHFQLAVEQSHEELENGRPGAYFPKVLYGKNWRNAIRDTIGDIRRSSLAIVNDLPDEYRSTREQALELIRRPFAGE